MLLPNVEQNVASAHSAMVQGYAPICCSSCRVISEPSEIPSSTSTVWVRIGGMVSGLPAIAATPTAIMAPEISPPGRSAQRNSTPPAAPMASVSSTLRVLVRLGMADAIDAGKRVTPPYGKSASKGQLRQRDAAMRARMRLSRPLPSCPVNGSAPTGRANARPMTGSALPDDRLQRAPGFRGAKARRVRPRMTSSSALADDDATMTAAAAVHFGLSAAVFLHSERNFL